MVEDERGHEVERAEKQGDYVDRPCEVPVKPTTMAGSLQLDIPTARNSRAKGRDPESKGDSSSLARWVPLLMEEIPRVLAVNVFDQLSDAKLKALTWDQRWARAVDCRIYQETRGRPHRKVVHPLSGTLSVDTAGPLMAGADGNYPRSATSSWEPLLGCGQLELRVILKKRRY